MSKVAKLLLKYGSLIKEKESGSCYYSVASKKVRVSEHFSPLNTPDDLQILIPSNSKKQYVVSCFGRIYVFNSYTELRVFIENWVLLAHGYKKRMNCLECIAVKNLTTQLNEAKAALAKLSKSTKDVKTESNLVDISKFTPAQKAQFALFLKQNSK